MMTGLWVVLNGAGGELDRHFAATEEQAARIAAAMILQTGSLNHGDTIVITDGEMED